MKDFCVCAVDTIGHPAKIVIPRANISLTIVRYIFLKAEAIYILLQITKRE